ncbi:hypothetical protein VTL71DRAFT_10470 [Oculimacula yallundae]|uniref:Uncharacterized protein n=1 Tax=Oculimacula yallundae TaxID=86028 RepID=A0ABR4CUK9_9HELO
MPEPPKWKVNGKVALLPSPPIFSNLIKPCSSQSLTAPLAAFTMATLLFVYTRTSIQAAKRNAQRHREADGGQINWHNESLRRHGKLDVPGEGNTVGELVGELRGEGKEGEKGVEGGKGSLSGEVVGETLEEKRVRERRRGGGLVCVNIHPKIADMHLRKKTPASEKRPYGKNPTGARQANIASCQRSEAASHWKSSVSY